MTLRNARILSSCNDASNKQEQKMNVNIKLEDKLPQQSQQSFANVPFYPQVPPANFTTPESMTPQPSQPSAGEFVQYPSTATSQTSQQIPTINRSIDLSGDILQKDLQIADLEDKNKFLQLLLRIYQDNPLYINSLVVCKAQDFMDLIKLLTKCDKVDLILNEDLACGGCGDTSKFIYISKILITKGNETKEMKYGYNEAYSKLISFNISTKIVC